MASLLTTAVLSYCITIASGSCPYVANYYWNASGISHSRLGTAVKLNTCTESGTQSHMLAGFGYNSNEYVCINDSVYLSFYPHASCQGVAREPIKVLPISEKYPGAAQHQYSCEDTGCTDYMNLLLSNKSLAEVNNEPTRQCTDPGIDIKY
eukprot:992064_1